MATNVRALQYLGGEIEIADAGDHLVARAPIGPFRRGLRLYPADAARDPDAYSVTNSLTGQYKKFIKGRRALPVCG